MLIGLRDDPLLVKCFILLACLFIPSCKGRSNSNDPCGALMMLGDNEAKAEASKKYFLGHVQWNDLTSDSSQPQRLLCPFHGSGLVVSTVPRSEDYHNLSMEMSLSYQCVRKMVASSLLAQAPVETRFGDLYFHYVDSSDQSHHLTVPLKSEASESLVTLKERFAQSCPGGESEQAARWDCIKGLDDSWLLSDISVNTADQQALFLLSSLVKLEVKFSSRSEVFAGVAAGSSEIVQTDKSTNAVVTALSAEGVTDVQSELLDLVVALPGQLWDLVRNEEDEATRGASLTRSVGDASSALAKLKSSVASVMSNTGGADFSSHLAWVSYEGQGEKFPAMQRVTADRVNSVSETESSPSWGLKSLDGDMAGQFYGSVLMLGGEAIAAFHSLVGAGETKENYRNSEVVLNQVPVSGGSGLWPETPAGLLISLEDVHRYQSSSSSSTGGSDSLGEQNNEGRGGVTNQGRAVNEEDGEESRGVDIVDQLHKELAGLKEKERTLKEEIDYLNNQNKALVLNKNQRVSELENQLETLEIEKERRIESLERRLRDTDVRASTPTEASGDNNPCKT